MDWLREREREAVEKVRAEIAKPLPEDEHDCGCDGVFNPWALFPCLYGSYSQEFDDMALLVLRNIDLARPDRWDEQDFSREELAHEMFREMLCVAELCAYGTSPRVCFANEPFKEVLPSLIARWEAYSTVQWGEPCDSGSGRNGEDP